MFVIAVAVLALTIYAVAVDPFSFRYALLAAWVFSFAAIVRSSVARRPRALQVSGALAGIGFVVLVSFVADMSMYQHSLIRSDALLILVTALGVGLVLVPAGDQGGFVTMPNGLFVYLTSLGIGLSAAAVVICVGWIIGLGPREDIGWAMRIRPVPQTSPSGNTSTVTTHYATVCEAIVDVIPPPWYVSTLAGLALITASGWQLRRSWRDRR
jgi:hypothetical protein